MREVAVEQQLREKVKSRLQGQAMKFVSPGCNGVPDRLVLLPEGKAIFVEVKAPGKRMRALQEYRKKQLESLGFEVCCLDTPEKVEAFIQSKEADSGV